MVFVLISNDCQVVHNTTEVIGVYETLERAFIGGWRFLLEDAMRPYTIKHYKNRTGEFAEMRGISQYYIEEWDAAKSACINIYLIGERPGESFDKFLKDNHEDCEELLQEWYDALQGQPNRLPDAMRNFTILRLK